MLFFNASPGRIGAKDPAVVKFGGVYYLYHSAAPIEGGKWGIGIAVSRDLERFEVVGEVPITQDSEQNGICAPGAIVIGGEVHLFYQSYGNGRRDAICHAVSRDGLNFIKDEGNPVYRPPASWCCGRAIDADVCAFGGKLLLYFATRDHYYETQKLGMAWAPLGSGFSRGAWRDGCSSAILAPELEWEKKCIEGPATLERGGRVYLFYGGAYNCEPQLIGCAVSSDGARFERVSSEPLLVNGAPGAWNASESGHPYAFRDDDGRDYLFYQGSPDGGRTWLISKACINWKGDAPSLEPDDVPFPFHK